MESAGLVLAQPTPAARPGCIGQRRDLLAGSCSSRRRLSKDGQRGLAEGIFEALIQFRESNLYQPQ